MIGPEKRLLTLSGSCGDRMKEKRPMIGSICGKLADVVVVTTEETYVEPSENVIDGIFAGIDQSQCEAHKIIDRKEAIKFFFDHAEPGDCVAICGMAGVTTMMTQEGQIPWNEKEIATTILNSIKE